MVSIRNFEEVSVRKTNNGAYEVSSMYGGIYRHRLYIGYTKAQAVRKFKKSLEKGEI